MVLLMIGTTELLLIAALALLLFGGKKLPELMRGLGSGVKNFKDGMNGITNPDEKTQELKSEKEEGQTDAIEVKPETVKAEQVDNNDSK